MHENLTASAMLGPRGAEARGHGVASMIPVLSLALSMNFKLSSWAAILMMCHVNGYRSVEHKRNKYAGFTLCSTVF